MGHRHKIHTYHWKEGRLEKLEHFFFRLDEAIAFVEQFVCDSYKIFDPDDVLIYSGPGDNDDSVYC